MIINLKSIPAAYCPYRISILLLMSDRRVFQSVSYACVLPLKLWILTNSRGTTEEPVKSADTQIHLRFRDLESAFQYAPQVIHLHMNIREARL
jgi:hypothetical protein